MMVVGDISFYNITLALTFHFTMAAKVCILYELRLFFLGQDELKALGRAIKRSELDEKFHKEVKVSINWPIFVKSY